MVQQQHHQQAAHGGPQQHGRNGNNGSSSGMNESYLVKKYRPEKPYRSIEAFARYTKAHRMLDASYVRVPYGGTGEKPYVFATQINNSELSWGRGKNRDAAIDAAIRAAFYLVQAHGYTDFPMDDDCLTHEPNAMNAGPPPGMGGGMGPPPLPPGMPPPPPMGKCCCLLCCLCYAARCAVCYHWPRNKQLLPSDPVALFSHVLLAHDSLLLHMFVCVRYATSSSWRIPSARHAWKLPPASWKFPAASWKFPAASRQWPSAALSTSAWCRTPPASWPSTPTTWWSWISILSSTSLRHGIYSASSHAS
jgi:hypothetical protein